jgi:hypothetical protein
MGTAENVGTAGEATAAIKKAVGAICSAPERRESCCVLVSQLKQELNSHPQAILAMSDAQIVTGISILAGGFSQLNCGLSIFHWHMVVRLAWFSSVTHLTTLTFLRRYIHDNHAIRMLRLVLMLALMLMLAVALIPTGGDCGLQAYSTDYLGSGFYGLTSYTDKGPVYPGSPAQCCFSAMSNKASFIGTNKMNLDLMIISEVLLICTSLSRVLKLFRSSSEFVKRWLRHKPAQLCKHVARKLEERYNDSYRKSTRSIYLICHCAIMAFIAFARAVYDCVDCLLFEVC